MRRQLETADGVHPAAQAVWLRFQPRDDRLCRSISSNSGWGCYATDLFDPEADRLRLDSRKRRCRPFWLYWTGRAAVDSSPIARRVCSAAWLGIRTGGPAGCRGWPSGILWGAPEWPIGLTEPVPIRLALPPSLKWEFVSFNINVSH